MNSNWPTWCARSGMRLPSCVHTAMLFTALMSVAVGWAEGGQESKIQLGDTVVTVRMTPLKIGSKELATVRPGTELVAEAINGNWVRVSIDPEKALVAEDENGPPETFWAIPYDEQPAVSDDPQMQGWIWSAHLIRGHVGPLWWLDLLDPKLATQIRNDLLTHCVAGLRSTDIARRYEAAEILGQLRDRRAVDPLLSAFEMPLSGNDEDAAPMATSWRGQRQPIDDEATRAKCVEALGEIGDTRVVPVLISHLEDEQRSHVSHLAIIDALGRLSDPRAVGPLLQYHASSQTTDVPCGNSAALGIGWTVPTAEDTAWQFRQQTAEQARQGRGLIATLLDLLDPPSVGSDPWQAFPNGPWRMPVPYHEEDTSLLPAVEQAVRRCSSVAATESLIAALENPRQRALVAEILGDLGDSRAVEPLLAALEKANTCYDASSIISALGRLGDKRALSAIIDRLRTYGDRSDFSYTYNEAVRTAMNALFEIDRDSLHRELLKSLSNTKP
ncbi:MAG: hypothetical protein FJ276_36000, partial [Planctomycetes bacterium]|nr:hypothetical protein [Planctomycetota bacterium]